MFNEQFNQDILNSLTAHIAVVDREGQIIAVNEAWRRFGAENGVKDSAAAGVGANYFAITAAAGAAEIEAGLRAVSLGQLPRFQMEYPCPSPTEPRWYLLNAVPLRGQAGAVVIAHTNITPLKEAELAHQKSEARFRSLAENSPDIIYILDLNNGRTLYFNRTDLLGYTLAELEQPGSIFEAVHPADAARLAEHWQRVKQGEPGVIEYRLRAKNGQWEWVQSRETPLVYNDDGSPAQVLVSLALITGRKQAEEDLRASRNLFEQVITSISDHIYATTVAADGSKSNLYMSPNVQHLTGYPPDIFLADWDFWASTVIHPEDRAAAAVQAARLDQGQDSELEYRMTRADGQVIWVRDSGRVVHEADGSRVIYGVVSEVTDRKQAEEKLRESEEKFRLMAENISDGILMINATNQLVYASPLLDAQLGQTIGETIKMSVEDIYERIHPEDRAETFENVFKAISQKSDSFTYTYRTKHAAGHYIWREDHAKFNYGPDGTHLNTYIICRDITRRKQAEAGLQQRNRELEFLNRVGQILISTLDLEQMMADLLEEARRLFNVFGCSVWLLEPATQELVCLQAALPHNDLLRGWKLAPAQGLVGWAVRHGQSVLMGDTRTDPRHYPEIDRRIGVEMRSVISTPLRVKQQVIGGLNVVDTAVGRFSPTDLSLIESLAATAAIAIENARLFEAEHRHRQAAEQSLHEIECLYRISRILAQAKEAQEAAIAQVLGEYLHALDLAQGGITLFDPARQAAELYLLYRHGQVQPDWLPLKIVSRVYQQLIETRQPVVIVQAESDPLLADNQELTTAHNIKSMLLVPLLVQGQVIGALGADATDQPRPFSAREISLGQAVADQVAGAIERIRLDETQRRLNAAMEQATETIIITDPADRIVYANPYFEVSSGYSVAEVLGQSPDFLRSDHHDPAFHQELWETISAGQRWHGRFVNKRKDGRLYYEEASICPVKNEAGKIINYATVKRDITERVQAEEALRESESRYRKLIELSPNGVAIYQKGLFVYVNPAGVKMLGAADQQQLLGTPIFNLVHPESREAVIPRMKLVAEGSSLPPLEEKLMRLDGSVFDAEVIALSTTFNDKPAVQVIARDISERKRADTELKNRLTYEHLLFRLSSMALNVPHLPQFQDECVAVMGQTLGVSRAYIFEHCYQNDTMSNVSEWCAPDVSPQKDKLQGIPADSMPWWGQTLQAGQNICFANIEDIPDKGAREILRAQEILSIWVAPLFVHGRYFGFLGFDECTRHRQWPDDEANLIMSMSRIITGVIERKQVEAEQEKMQVQLSHAQKLESVGRLAGGVAHDFNNILTIIIGLCGLLLMRHTDESDRTTQDLRQIERAANRAADLTRQLLAFSRRQMLQPQLLDLNEIVTNMEKMLRLLIRDDIQLVTSLMVPLRPVYADPGQIEQVLMNLIVNARDAMPHGGRLTIKTAHENLDSLHAPLSNEFETGLYVTLIVSDTGIGMDAATREQIFDPFFTTKPEGQGTGLGLATVHGIVTQSKGYLTVDSQPGQGAIFKVYLPPAEEIATAPGKQKLPNGKTLPPSQETILLVEDETSVRYVTQQILHRYGYHVLVAADGQAALQIAAEYQRPIHLLLTDMVMPGQVSGHEMIESLVAQRPDLKVLLMSGYAEQLLQSPTSQNYSHFIQKPFAPAALLQKVLEVLNHPSG